MLTSKSRTGEPITLDDAQEELRQAGRDFQRLTTRNITAAIRYVERKAQITLHDSSQWTMTLPDWPNYDGDGFDNWHGWYDYDLWDPSQYRVVSPVLLPMPPWVTTDQIDYYDQDNNPQTVDSANYRTRGSDTAPAELEFDDDFIFPTLKNRKDAVSITYTTGGSAVDQVGITAAVQYLHYLIDRDMAAKDEADSLIRDIRNTSYA